MSIKKHIPNFFTCLNLVCGCAAVLFSYTNHLDYAAWLIGIAAIFDFFDGMAARLLKVHSEIGKQLDSLADMVTFGVAPGAIMFMLIRPTLTPDNAYLVWISFLIPVFSALRLAKFNIDTRQSDSFIGVPTPANAILIASLPLISKYEPLAGSIIYNTNTLLLLTVLMSFLLVSEIYLIALKFKSFGWNGNELRFILIGISVILLLWLHFVAIPIIIFLYIIISLISNIISKDKNLAN